MRGRLLAAAVSAMSTVAVGVAGCAAPDTATPAAPAKPATGVCVGVDTCRVVASEDVDGDGVPDQVGFVVASERRVVVHVKTAAGDRLRAQHHQDFMRHLDALHRLRLTGAEHGDG